MQREVLIITSSSGGAHNALAAAAGSVLQEITGVTSEVIDIHDYLDQGSRWGYQKGQFFLMNTFPRLSGFFVRQVHGSTLLAKIVRRRYAFPAQLENVVAQRRPALVVATHALGALLYNRVPPAQRPPLILLTVNYEAHHFLVQPSVTTYCVPHACVQDDLLKLGVPANRIVVTGMPLPSNYDTWPNQATARRQLGLPADGPVVLVSQGATGSGAKTVPLVLQLKKALPTNTTLLVVTGRNHTTLQALHTLHLPARVHLVAFVENFPVYLRAADVFVGKAGGTSSTAAFRAGVPLVIVSPSAHEARSARRFAAAGVALFANYSTRRAAQQTKLLLTDTARRNALIEKAAAFVVPNAREHFLEAVRALDVL